MALPVLFGISFTYLVTAKNKEIAKTNREIAVAIKALQQDTIGSENNKMSTFRLKKITTEVLFVKNREGFRQCYFQNQW